MSWPLSHLVHVARDFRFEFDKTVRSIYVQMPPPSRTYYLNQYKLQLGWFVFRWNRWAKPAPGEMS